MKNKLILLLTVSLCALILCSCKNKDKGDKDAKDTKTGEKTETPEEKAERDAAKEREDNNFKALQGKTGTPLGTAGIVCTKGPDGKINCPSSSTGTKPTTTTTTTPPATPAAPQ